MAPASKSCTQGCHGHGHAVPGMGFCRWENSWAGSNARREALATSMSRYGTTLLSLCTCPSLSQAHGGDHEGQKPGTLPGCGSTVQWLPKSSAHPDPPHSPATQSPSGLPVAMRNMREPFPPLSAPGLLLYLRQDPAEVHLRPWDLQLSRARH